jgi:hypothetical protein
MRLCCERGVRRTCRRDPPLPRLKKASHASDVLERSNVWRVMGPPALRPPPAPPLQGSSAYPSQGFVVLGVCL